MDKTLQAAILLLASCVILTGCTSEPPSSHPETATGTAGSSAVSQTASPERYTIPDVIDDSFWDAVNRLNSIGQVNVRLEETDVIADALGIEELVDPNDYPEIADFTVRETDPEAGDSLPENGTISIYVDPPLPQEAKGHAWQAECGPPQKKVFGQDNILEFMATHKAATCQTNRIPGSKLVLSKDEEDALKLANKSEFYGADSDFEDLLDLCTKPELSPSDIGDRYLFGAAAKICPNSPLADTLAGWGNGSIFDDGSYEVGSDVVPGTYVSSSPAKNCYWERSTAHGSVIDNDFIVFARKGAKAILNSGESFHSENCGTWKLQ